MGFNDGQARATCPSLYIYPPQAQAKLAQEIDAMPKDAVTPNIMADYAKVREQIRICRGVL
jgi:hypothetical protein